MIYVKGKWLSVKEASDQLTNLSKHSHKIFRVSCDFNAAEKCRKEYDMEFRYALKIAGDNDGKIICLNCSRFIKFSNRNNPNTKYKSIDDNFFSHVDSSNKAYLLGWIASDGHIGKRGFKIMIHQKDIITLQILRNIICAEVPIVKFTTETSDMCSFEINSQKISKDLCCLLQMNPGRKCETVKFPKISDCFLWDFIKGYFEGDGSVNDPSISKSPYVKGNIRSNSKHMLGSIKKISMVPCSITNRALYFSGKGMMAFLDKMYSTSSPNLQRKYKRYTKWKNINGKRDNKIL